MSELIESRRIWFFDERGDFHGKKSFSKHDKIVKYGSSNSKGAYNINLQELSYKEDVVIPFLWKRKTYFFPTWNSGGFKFDKNSKGIPPISPEIYNVQLETKVAKDLNDLSNRGLLGLLNPKVIIGIVIIAIIAYYFLSGHKLF